MSDPTREARTRIDPGGGFDTALTVDERALRADFSTPAYPACERAITALA